jgi:hypothetical protein
MAVVIDQFEIVKDERTPAEPARADEPAPHPSGQPALSAQDIQDAVDHNRRRALRLRAS